ncbi:MAG TPA: hypothetical protein VHM94_02790 [Acidimicrobiia bacterium]|nr:hypothetical protein [Acidimicrobiia bacterium]
MRLRAGLVIGFGAGYIVGAAAGRERYEQIARTWRTALESQSGQAVVEAGRKLTGQMRELAGRGMEAASSTIKRTVNSGEEADQVVVAVPTNGVGVSSS